MSPVVTVVGLGPAGPELVTAETRTALASAPARVLRTRRHPAAQLLADDPALDDVYEQAERLDEVYPALVDRVVRAAEDHGAVAYAVPGSPMVAERSVELLLADERVEVEVFAALSFLDLAWVRLGIDPLATGVRLVDGHRFEVEAAGERGPLLVAQCDSRFVLSDVKLAVEEAPERPVTVLSRLGLPDERVVEVAWEDLDRVVDPDHLTSLWIPELAAPVGREVVRFHELVRTLRRECPWDREQTHESLSRHLIEEAYEVVEAIDGLEAGEGLDALEEELGDLLFQVSFHAVLGEEDGAFTLADVARGIHDKLVRRHPHVFASVEVGGADDVVRNWEQIKKAEKGRGSVMDGVPAALPALIRAQKVIRKAATLGLDADQLGLSAEGPADLGRDLLRMAAAARVVGVDAEEALRRATDEVVDRVRSLEANAQSATTTP
jgi:tetrapyrrole methylase family protein / MazG family protein